MTGAGQRGGVEPPPSRLRGAPIGFIEWASRTLAKGMLPGLIVGLVVGGLGSRVAMRVLTLTSVQSARGLETDFGATIGEITFGGTLFLLIAGSVLGMAGGIAYLPIRRLLPRSIPVRTLIFALLLLALVGRLLVEPGNTDFRIVSPAGLAVTMFAALPVLFGLLFVPLAERLEPVIERTRRRSLVIGGVGLGLVPLSLASGFGLLVIAGSFVAWAFRDSIGSNERRAIRLTASVLLGAAVVWRGALFLDGVVEIL